MLIKIKDHRIVASDVSWFSWSDKDVKRDESSDVIPCLIVCMKSQYPKMITDSFIYIEGPKTLLGMFEKQYKEIMDGK